MDNALSNLIGMEKIPSTFTFGDWLKRQGNSEGLKALKKVIDITKIFIFFQFKDNTVQSFRRIFNEVVGKVLEYAIKLYLKTNVQTYQFKIREFNILESVRRQKG